MLYLCKLITDRSGMKGIRIFECRGLDSLVVIPEEIKGQPVIELAPYIFSAQEDYEPEDRSDAFWWGEGEPEELSIVNGNALTELKLPRTLKKVGAYGFYNCENLRSLELYSTTMDWGAGVFTGCFGVEAIRIYVDETQKSCMKELLMELRQSLVVSYVGKGQAMLIFSDFFEEAVENTPARILVTNTHGCGKQYRNAFVRTQFQFHEYDSLFPYVKVQEPEELVTELALGRLMFPYELESAYQNQYEEYVKTHNVAAASQAMERSAQEEVRWLLEHIPFSKEELEQVISLAVNGPGGSLVSELMDQKRKQGSVKRRRFQL